LKRGRRARRITVVATTALAHTLAIMAQLVALVAQGAVRSRMVIDQALVLAQRQPQDVVQSHTRIDRALALPVRHSTLVDRGAVPRAAAIARQVRVARRFAEALAAGPARVAL